MEVHHTHTHIRKNLDSDVIILSDFYSCFGSSDQGRAKNHTSKLRVFLCVCVCVCVHSQPCDKLQ